MKKIIILISLSFLTTFGSLAQTIQITNYTGYSWDIDVYIAPISLAPIPSGCNWLYSPLTPNINRVDVTSMVFHASGTIPDAPITGQSGCPITGYCAFWSGDETSIGIPSVPPGWTVVRVVFRKGPSINTGFYTGWVQPMCPDPLTAMAEVDEFTNTGTCAPREPKYVISSTSCPTNENKFWFLLDHFNNSCTYCAEYNNNIAGISITNW